MRVTTNPPGAHCDIDRSGAHIGTVDPTPGSLHFDKSKNDVTVSCKEQGYQAASVTQSPKFVGTTFGNIVAGGLVGVAVDAASGANYQYPDEIKVELAPLASSTETKVTPAAATVPAVQTQKDAENPVKHL
jgi:hypothetical protein